MAIDDSRSMGENGCGSFALEAVTLICRAMARLEVGEMGVVSYGGSNSILPLHPLEKPFTDADGPGIMAQMKFSQVPCLSLFFIPMHCLGRPMVCCKGCRLASRSDSMNAWTVVKQPNVKQQALHWQTVKQSHAHFQSTSVRCPVCTSGSVQAGQRGLQGRAMLTNDSFAGQHNS